ncbi:MAG: hypothetical protein ABI904_16170 [Chloroflexota bacterium]
MTTLSSKTSLRQEITLFESQGSIALTRNDEIQIDSNAGIFVLHDSKILPVKRLVVLVPNVDMDEVQIARQVWEMAAPVKLAVLLLSICTDISEELRIQRRLITLAALIRDPRVAVEIHIEDGSNWCRAVKSVLENGDVILCHAKQSVGFLRKPLIDLLDALHVPIWTLSGYYPLSPAPRHRRLSLTIFWFVVLAILAGFFYLQTQINNSPDNLAKNVMLCLSAIFEIGSLYVWNSIF